MLNDKGLIIGRQTKLPTFNNVVIRVGSDAHISVPDFWSENAAIIANSHYLCKDAAHPEDSINDAVERLANFWHTYGIEEGLFATQESADNFKHEITCSILSQEGSPNSPTWYNAGLHTSYNIAGSDIGLYRMTDQDTEAQPTGNTWEHPCCMACFLLDLEDHMMEDGGIYYNLNTEARIFRSGGGTGINLSKLRARGEKLSNGGHSSGPLSFGRIMDRNADCVKSGGRNRRAAKLIAFDIDHPDVIDFINLKPEEEKKVQALVNAGYDSSYQGEAYSTVSWQTSNHSIMTPDEFFIAMEHGEKWQLKGRKDKTMDKLVEPSAIWNAIGDAAWKCGDPGLLFDTTINAWNPCIADAKIETTNPCFTGDTRILTNRGLIPIQELVQNAVQKHITYNVLNKENQWTPLSQYLYTGYRPIIDVTLSNGTKIQTTPNHKWILSDGSVIHTEDLQIGMSVNNKAQFIEFPNCSYDLPVLHDSLDGYRSGRSKKLNVSTPVVINTDIAHLYGYLMGDGFLTRNHNLFGLVYGTTNSEDQNELMPYHQKTFTDYFNGLELGLSFNTNKCAQLRITSSQLLNYLESLGFYRGASIDKVVPEIIYRVPSDIRAAFIRGFLDADGSVNGNIQDGECSITASSCSKQLLLGVQHLLSTLGISSTVKLSRPAGRRAFRYTNTKGTTVDYESKNEYRLYVNPHDIQQFADVIGFRLQYKQERLVAQLQKRRNIKAQPMDLLTIVDIQNNNEYQHVYNITEPITNVVHVASMIPIMQCGEITFLPNTSCNLASLNLCKFISKDNTFDFERFMHVVRIWTIALEITVYASGLPNKRIAEQTYRYRPLGLGFTNVGGLLMRLGLAYDSEKGRTLIAKISSVMTATAYATSSEMARAVGKFARFDANKKGILRVIHNHRVAAIGGEYRNLSKPYSVLADGDIFLSDLWNKTYDMIEEHGLRNAQVTAIAPTGTISFIMDCDTMGIEPDFSLIKHKHMSTGETIKIVNNGIRPSLISLGYSDNDINKIIEATYANNDITSAAELHPKHYSVFACASGNNAITPLAHIEMVAAVQPHISGGISKTINLPNSATVEDIMNAYMLGWTKGLKGISVYRDRCKLSQPLSNTEQLQQKPELKRGERYRLPYRRAGITRKVTIDNRDLLSTINFDENGDLGEIFAMFGGEGGTVSQLLGLLMMAFSMLRQYGCPTLDIVRKFKTKPADTGFSPQGLVTGDPHIKTCKSPVDYIMKAIALECLSNDTYTEIKFDEVELSPLVVAQLNGNNSVTIDPYEEVLFDDCPNCGLRKLKMGKCQDQCQACGHVVSKGCA